MYLLQSGGRGRVRATLLGSGTILRECLAAARAARERLSECRRTSSRSPASASCGARRSSASAGTLLHPGEAPRVPYVQRCLKDRDGADRRRDRLHAHRAGSDPAMGRRPLRDARHGWLRPLGHARGSAQAFRGRPQLHRPERLKALGDEGKIDRATVTRRDSGARHRPGEARPHNFLTVLQAMP